MALTQPTPKERLMSVLQDQPEDSSFEELLREMAFARMIDRGVDDSENGRTISHEELLQRIRSWAE
jgi:predicted transcriptional regulator